MPRREGADCDPAQASSALTPSSGKVSDSGPHGPGGLGSAKRTATKVVSQTEWRLQLRRATVEKEGEQPELDDRGPAYVYMVELFSHLEQALSRYARHVLLRLYVYTLSSASTAPLPATQPFRVPLTVVSLTKLNKGLFGYILIYSHPYG